MKSLLNSVRLIGNAGTNPEVMEFEGGKKLAKVNMATTDMVKLQSGETINNTQWHRLIAWGNLATILERSVKKGQRMVVEGKLQHRNYVGADGLKKQTSEVLVQSVLLIGGKEKSKGEEPEPPVSVSEEN